MMPKKYRRYYSCSKCNKTHIFGSKIGNAHEQYMDGYETFEDVMERTRRRVTLVLKLNKKMRR